jgi:hypothetical protein
VAGGAEGVRELDADPAVRLIVCAGDGDKAFISGADISQFEKLRGTVEAQIVYNKAVETPTGADELHQAGGGAHPRHLHRRRPGLRRGLRPAHLLRGFRSSACRRRAWAWATARRACAAS